MVFNSLVSIYSDAKLGTFKRYYSYRLVFPFYTYFENNKTELL